MGQVYRLLHIGPSSTSATQYAYGDYFAVDITDEESGVASGEDGSTGRCDSLLKSGRMAAIFPGTIQYRHTLCLLCVGLNAAAYETEAMPHIWPEETDTSYCFSPSLTTGSKPNGMVDAQCTCPQIERIAFLQWSASPAGSVCHELGIAGLCHDIK